MFEQYAEYNKLIKSRLKPARYQHSKNVADMAQKLAKKYGYDENRAYLAGLLHDICKNDTNENILKMFEKFGIIIDNVSLNEPKLWHAIAGAAYIKNVLKIDDDEIISAVRYHTTGRADMLLLDKIIYIADFTSADRDFEGVEDIRKALEISLDYAVLEGQRFSIISLASEHKLIHKDSIESYNQLSVELSHTKNY